ncbi:MAG: DUF998 domain-containing protein, partial [Methanomassiliicoccales archaeon]|nr:DUF998 domain-containing protein [Methanomassiliicoccales archaeon]
MPATKWLMIIGGAAGLVLPIFFAVMWTLAAVVNGHWVLGRDTLSELGGQVPSRWIFNVAVIVSGVLGIDFSFRLFVKFADSRLGRAGSVVLAIASIGLVSVGVFPIDTGQPHTIASVFFFTVVALSV